MIVLVFDANKQSTYTSLTEKWLPFISSVVPSVRFPFILLMRRQLSFWLTKPIFSLKMPTFLNWMIF